MSDFGQPPGGGGFGQPPGGGGGGGFGQPPAGGGGGGFGQPPAGGGGGGFGQPPAGGQPQGGFAPAPAGPGGGGEQKTETMAIIAAVCGVLSLPACCCYCFPIPIAAIVLGVLGLKKVNADPSLKGKELAYVGIAGGGLGILLVIVGVILNLVGGPSPDQYYNY